jgi:hypothetical protein
MKSRLPFHPYRRGLAENSYFATLGWAGEGATTIHRLVRDFGGAPCAPHRLRMLRGNEDRACHHDQRAWQTALQIVLLQE